MTNFHSTSALAPMLEFVFRRVPAVAQSLAARNERERPGTSPRATSRQRTAERFVDRPGLMARS
jgi:hypothetical protein